jgi:hypothetical protein
MYVQPIFNQGLGQSRPILSSKARTALFQIDEAKQVEEGVEAEEEPKLYVDI